MRSIAFCAALWLLSLSSSAAADLGNLKGTVTDLSGAIINHVLVRVEYWRLDRSTYQYVVDEKTAYTGWKGEYSLELPAGVYDIFFSCAPFSPVAKKVEVKSGKVTLFSPNMKYDRLTKFVE